MSTHRSRRKATSPRTDPATTPSLVGGRFLDLDDLRYSVLQIASLALAAKATSTIPAEGTPGHGRAVGRLVVLVDLLAGCATATLDQADLLVASRRG
jgi:hypothetical protein